MIQAKYTRLGLEIVRVLPELESYEELNQDIINNQKEVLNWKWKTKNKQNKEKSQEETAY